MAALQRIVNQRTETYFREYVLRDIEYQRAMRPPAETSLFTMLDTLAGWVTQCGGHGWIGEAAFSSELSDLVATAKAHLQANDSSNCAGKISNFQTLIDEEYRDSLDGDNRFVTIEGWKFLYHNAQYTLDRLPPPPPVPVQLYYFRATPQVDRSVVVEWGTLSETNNYGFEVQKKPDMSAVYQAVTFVPGHGTTNEPQEYSAVDAATSEGTWHYRLKQIDFDGTANYTEPVVVLIAGDGSGVQWWYFDVWPHMDNSVLIEWGTLTETENELFEVQKRAGSSGDFEVLAQVGGAGTTEKPQHYTYVEPQWAGGYWEYRIAQRSMSGAMSFTEAIGMEDPELPVAMESMSAVVEGSQQVRLRWATRRESRSRYFEVQISRGDSLHFWTLPGSRVHGAGRSNTTRNYTYMQRVPRAGTWYFRLRHTAPDGTTCYSQSVRVVTR